MTSPDADRRLLLVHAHPDDESIGTGATMAKYVSEGVHVTLVTCTLGEEGEVLVPALAQLAADQADQLGGWRISELADAMRHLGVSDHRFLGGAGRFRDSGMMGTDANTKHRAFWRADSEPAVFADAVRHLVEVIREVRPQVVVTYDEFGGYGHPDHIMAHRVTMAAVEAAALESPASPASSASPDGLSGAAGAPWSVSKVYWTAMPRSVMAAGFEALKAADNSPFAQIESLDDVPFIIDDELVTTCVDGDAFIDAKAAALTAHATQITADGPFFALSNNLGQKTWGVEYFRLIHGKPGGPTDADGREVDLFGGLAE